MLKQIEEKLGYTFHNPKLLKQALTHSSFTADIHENYERLEFLGDRILGVTVAEMLCRMFPDEPEGNLSQRFVGLVCKDAVAEVVRELGVENGIVAANVDVRDSLNVLCDVGEALIAAIYLDSGDMTVAQNFIRQHWAPLIDRKSRPHKDFKTKLQEEAHHFDLNPPLYRMLKKTGSEHEPLFQVKVSFDNGQSAVGVGKSKKLAEQEAARKMLGVLGVNND